MEHLCILQSEIRKNPNRHGHKLLHRKPTEQLDRLLSNIEVP